MNNDGKKSTKPRKTTTVKSLPVKDAAKAVKGGNFGDFAFTFR